MAVILLILCFALTFCCCGILLPSQTGKRVILLISVLFFSALIVVSTEIQSLFKLISYYPVLIWWLMVSAAMGLCLISRKIALAKFKTRLTDRLNDFWQGLTITERVLAALLSVLFLLIVVQGIIYPPNNWDSMTYHLARIVSWLAHHSVAHYPTAITRQIYQPPFAEYLILQINLLSGGDYLSATVQFCFYFAVLINISLIAKETGLNRRHQLLSVLIGATIPEVILQASSTQNDIVISFFVLAAALFAYKAIRQPITINFICLGLAVGLGLFTKGTGYVYLAPVLLLFGIAVIVKIIKTRNYQYLSHAVLAGLLCVAINAAFYYRNYQMAGNLLGVDKSEMKLYSNQKMSAGLLFSNLLKNAALHSDVLYANHLDQKADTAMYRLHRAMGIDINDPAVNYRGNKFSAVSDLTGEDSAPNLIHLLIFISAVIVFALAKQKKSIVVWLILLVLIAQYIFLCSYLKWQPWNTRLHTPLFLLMAPFVVYVASLVSGYRKVLCYVLVPVLLFEGFIICLHNSVRPYDRKLFAKGFENNFINNPKAYPDYQSVKMQLQQGNFKNVGLMVGEDDWIYPLFTCCYHHPVNPIYLNVHNNTAKANADTGKVDCIVSTNTTQTIIDYKGKRFYKQDAENKIIALYK